MQSTEQKIERAALAGLAAASMDERERSTDISLAELAALVETAGGQPVVTLLQNKPTPDPRTFLGEGKVAELRELIVANDCDLAVFDNELSPSQMRVLEEELGVRVLDRSGLILDIFAQRAQTREGQLQVELAQYQYLLPRLTGMWTHLVRQTASGGSSPIGTRGPGETQLETDRRHIRRKIQKLQSELEDVRKIRRTQRRRREKNALPVVALVGYTNAGKSTLLNCLTGSDIPANDRLFDTLDTTTRRWRIDAAQEVLLSDTVGFIRKLPTHLVEAFKATLEELTYADVLLHVIDLSNPEWEAQAEVVDRLIDQLGAAHTPCIRVFNKCDAYLGILPHGENIVCISARSGEGAAELTERVRAILGRADHHVTLLLPYAQGALLETLHRDCAVLHKRSRFLGLVRPVGSEDEARTIIAACKKQYHDARHNCWCYLLRDGTERYSDDGEPQGTAGIPMLEVFRRAGVTNVVCVVTRYFGGVLLGTGGLLRAYTAAAADALADAGISEVRRWLACEVSTPYALYEPVRAAVAALGGVVQETQYAAAVTVCALLPEEAGEAFAAQVRDLTAGRCAVRPVGETERAVPLAGAGL